MTRRLSIVVSSACTALLILMPLAIVFYLINLDALATLISNSTSLPIQWETVLNTQWYAMWALTTAHISIGLTGLYFLRRAFINFAKGEFFNTVNSQDVRRFSILLLIQTLLTPIHFALSSVLLSVNHPAGEKILSLTFSSNELQAVGVALILWVMSHLLVEGSRLQSENQQFV